MQAKHIKIMTLGFDQRSIDTLALAFQNKLKGSCIITQNDAQIVLINLDNKNTLSLYNESEQKVKSLPAIGISKTIHSDWDIPQVKIPISTTQLAQAIEEILDANQAVGEKHMTERSTITEDKIAKAMAALDAKKVAAGLDKKIKSNSDSKTKKRAVPQKQDEMCFDIERFLLWTILEAKKKLESVENKVAVIRCLDDKHILLNLKQSEVLTDLSENQLRAVAIAPVNDNSPYPIEIKYISEREVAENEIFNGKKARGIQHETFMWNLGLMTSRGRIPMETMGSDRQYIRRWPNITRLHLCDNALQILAYWVRQPCSLYELNEKTGLPLPDIFSIYTAAYACGLAGLAKRDSDKLMAADHVQENKKRGLFSSIVNRLRNFNKEAA